jgi:hypothetical protein
VTAHGKFSDSPHALARLALYGTIAIYPALHTHALELVLEFPTVVVSTGQSVHAALPLFVLYLPETHNVHAPDSPVLPAGQSKSHAANAVLPAGDAPPAPQDVHAFAPVAPVASDQVPAIQSVHEALPLLVLYLPATHVVHEPAGPVLPAAQSNTHAVRAVLPVGE